MYKQAARKHDTITGRTDYDESGILRNSLLRNAAVYLQNKAYFILCLHLVPDRFYRAAQQGEGTRLPPSPFSEPFLKARNRITALITSKLDDFFDLSGYNWTPNTREETPSMYLYELVNWLTTVVDSLVIKETYKNDAYTAAVRYIAESMMVPLKCIIWSTLKHMSLSEFHDWTECTCHERKRDSQHQNGHHVLRSSDHKYWAWPPHLRIFGAAFRRVFLILFGIILLSPSQMAEVVLQDKVQEYLHPSVRQTSYGDLKPRRLQTLLEKLVKYAVSRRDHASRGQAEKRRKEAEAVGRLV